MATGGANPAVTLSFRVRDEASPILQNVGNQMDATSTQADDLARSYDSLAVSAGNAENRSDGLFQSFARNSDSFIIAGAAIASASAAIAQLGTAIGIIPEEMEQTVSNTVAAIGAIAALAGAMAQLVPLIRAVALAERSRAIASAIANAFANPAAAIAGLAIAAAVGIGASVLISKFLQTPEGQFRRIAGSSTTSELAMVHGGEVIARPDASGNVPGLGGGGNGTQNTINVGTLVADEMSLRELERRMGRIRLEERRTRGVNS